MGSGIQIPERGGEVLGQQATYAQDSRLRVEGWHVMTLAELP
jgi:hypothetical protein